MKNMKNKILLFVMLSVSSLVFGNNLETILPVIKQVESRGITDVIGDNGKAFGILQIHKVCVDDVNRIYGTNYTHEDAFNETCSEEIFKLYISYGIKRYISKYNKKPTEQDIVRMWNGGIYSGYKRPTTIKYWKSYKYFKNKQSKNHTIKFIISKKIKKYDYYYLVVRDVRTGTIYQRISLHKQGVYTLDFTDYDVGKYVVYLYNNGKLISNKYINISKK